MLQKQSPKNYLRFKYYFLITIFCALGFLSLYLLDQYFIIQRIEIISPNGKIVVNGLENLQKKNFFLTSENEIIKTITQSNPQLKNVRAEKKYPDKLIIRAETDSSIAALKVNQGYFLLNLSGKILTKDKSNSNRLPKINYYQKLNYNAYNIGDQIDLQDIIASLHFAKKTREMGLLALSIDIGGVDMIRLNLHNKKNLIFSTDKDINIQDYQFEKLIRQFKIEARDFESLDFRFDKPIIKLK